MKRKTSRLLVASLVLLSLAVSVTGWLFAYPYPLIDPGRGDNLLLLDDGPRLLETAAPATILYNRLMPDRDREHGRVLVRRPMAMDSVSAYPLLLVVQQAGEKFDSLAGQWPAMDSCYVMVVSSRASASAVNPALRLLDSTLVAMLNHSGMRIDPDYITLVDRTASGDAWRHFRHRRLRNIVFTAGVGNTEALPARRIHFVPASAADTACCRAALRRCAGMWLDADLHDADDATPLRQTLREIILERHPISQTRLALTRGQVTARGYDERYAMFVDFSIPSGKNRFFLYDYARDTVVLRSKCAHGCGFGSTDAVPRFSNEPGSCATSLGLYEVDDIHRMYKNGRVAINLQGLEAGNSNARMRGVKIHGGMRYEGEIYPRLLRIGKLSEGCFALSNIPLAAVLVTVEQTAPRHILLSAYTR